jgi:hypothetical protein
MKYTVVERENVLYFGSDWIDCVTGKPLTGGACEKRDWAGQWQSYDIRSTFRAALTGDILTRASRKSKGKIRKIQYQTLDS